MRRQFDADLRAGLRRLHAERDVLLAITERLPRTVCHLDVWPDNPIRRPGGAVVLLDRSFVGWDGDERVVRLGSAPRR